MIFKKLIAAAGVLTALGVAAPAFAQEYVPVPVVAPFVPAPIVPAPLPVAWGYGRRHYYGGYYGYRGPRWGGPRFYRPFGGYRHGRRW